MKRCPDCNRTYADETLTFCLADGSLLSAPYDPQATEILSELPKTIPASPPELWSPPLTPTASTKRGRNYAFYFLISLVLLIASVVWIAWWTQGKSATQVGSTGPNPAIAITPTQAPGQPSPTPAPSAVQQQTPFVAQASTPPSNSDELPILYGQDGFYPRQDSVFRLRPEATSGSVLGIGDAVVAEIDARSGAVYGSGMGLMYLDALLTCSQVSSKENPLPPTTTEKVRVFVDSAVRLQVVRIMVRDGQRIHPGDVLLYVRRP